MSKNESMTLQSTLQQLEIPSEFKDYDTVSESDVIVRLEQWRKQAIPILATLRDLTRQLEGELERSEQVHLTFVVSSFDGEGPWITKDAKQIAQQLLDAFGDTDTSLSEQILNEHVKPIFRANPHPSVNATTGRKLPRALGGPLAQQDYYEGQFWKSHPGLPNTISWCIRHIKAQAYEKIWHLIIPPIMTLLDDYEVRYKIRGAEIVSELLKAVPSELLKRTGVDSLLYTSLRGCLNFLHNPDSPALILTSIPVMISLITLTTVPGSAQRFEKLCSILGDGIIGSIWLYGSRDLETIEATLEVLPQLIGALGIATTRFLKGLMPQLIHPLISEVENLTPVKFQLKTLNALSAVIDTCAPRMHKWKGTVLDGVGRRWVLLVDSGADDADALALKEALKDVVQHLARASPSIKEEELQVLLQTDPVMFRPLLEAFMLSSTPPSGSGLC